MRADQHLLVISVAFLILFLANCGGGGGTPPQPSPQPPATTLSPTTTLAAVTSNNTSAADSFTQQTNGNARAGNVSKAPISSLLYPGSTTKVYAHLVAWFGGSGHMNVGYRSDDPAQVHRQVEDMMSRGIQGAIIDWYGPAATTVNTASMLLRQEAEAHPGQFQFAIMEDGGALFQAAVANHCDVTDQLLSDLSYIAAQFEPSPAYLQINGRPAVFFFGVDTYYIDWSRVAGSAPNHPLLLLQGAGGLQRTISDGGFQWVDINSTDPFNPELAAQDSFYSAAVANPGRLAFGSAYKGFNDTLAIWGTNRFVYQGCGATWLATFNEISKFYSANHQLQALQLVTWNDYEEGTAIEPGIDNCVYLTPSLSGGTLNWDVAGGSETTIDHYTVFISTDGQNLAKLADVAVGTHSFDLGHLALAPGTYTLYIKVVGRASFQNKMSAAITFHPGDQPPSASLAVNQTGFLTVSASAAGSSDPDGSIARSTIDFGDGTVANGPTASHTYAIPGTYNITATAFDNAGASGIAIQRTSVKPPSNGVTLFSPTTGIVNWPTSFIASATLANSVTAMQIFVDGQLLYTIDRDSINTTLKIFHGSHEIDVQATDNTGATSISSVNVTAEPDELTPTANVTVTPMPDISPTTILACTADSTDPDGFFISRKLQFSDGITVFRAAALHTFAAPGAYSVTATVIDQFGVTAAVSQTVGVETGGAP